MRTENYASGLLLLLVLSMKEAISQTTQGVAQNELRGASESTSPAASVPQSAVPAPVHPMAAYLSLRPVLPGKTAFFPPMVDPNAYIDRKAWMLSNLFGSPIPTYAGTFPAPGYPFFDPAYFAAKKNIYFSNPYSSQQPPSATGFGVAKGTGVLGQSRRALPPSVGFPFAPGVFAAKKTAFLQKLFETLNTTSPPPAPTTQPSWMNLLDIDSQSQDTLPRVPLSPASSLVDPALYANKKTQFLSQLFDSIGLPPPPSAVTQPIVPPNYWFPFGAPPSLGVPFPKPTIVPPGYWTPSGIPTPGAIYKQKVADFLGRLFQQLNSTSNITASGTEKRNVSENEGEEEIAQTKKQSISRRGIVGPFAGPFGFGKPFATSSVDPQFFADKKNAFLSKLLVSKGTSGSGDGPGVNSVSSSWGPYGDFYATPKPTIVPPDFWNPFPAGKPIPATSPIFSQITGLATKPTVVPPDFWSPFAQLKQKNNAMPSQSQVVADSKDQTNDTLFDGRKSSCPFCVDENPTSLSQQSKLSQQSLELQSSQSQDPTVEEESLWDTFLKELSEALSAPVHRSSRSVSPELARQQLQDSAMTQLTAIKDDMVNTVNSILKQKSEASAAASAFPFGKSAYAAYGAMKKGGGSSPGAAGKKGGPPGKGGFWGGPPAVPTADPTEPLQQRLLVLSNAFDSLAALQKDASAALQSVSTPDTPNPSIRLPYSSPNAYPVPVPNAATSMDPATLLQLLRAMGSTNEVVQGKATRKTKSGRSAPRSLQFAVRQGQFSLPAGAEELLTAGGGTSPEQREGGGLRLQIKVPAVARKSSVVSRAVLQDSEQDAEAEQMEGEEEMGLPKWTHQQHSHHQ